EGEERRLVPSCRTASCAPVCCLLSCARPPGPFATLAPGGTPSRPSPTGALRSVPLVTSLHFAARSLDKAPPPSAFRVRRLGELAPPPRRPTVPPHTTSSHLLV